MSAPRLSIGLPVYNGEPFLEDALNSLLTQDYTDFELIISDNASTDATSSICQDYAARDRRIRYHRFSSNEGAVRNLNHVFTLARGEFFKWAAHDDICLPGFFGRCMETFDAEPPFVVLVYPRTEFIDDAGRPVSAEAECLELRDARAHRRLSYVLTHLSNLCAQYGVIRSNVLRRTRLHDRFTAGDFVLMAELALLGEFREVPQVLFLRRIHSGMSSANRDWASRQAWHDPNVKPVSPVIRLGVEYMRSVSRLPIAQRDRWKCYCAAIWSWHWREFRNWGGRHKRRVIDTISFNGRR